MLPVSTAGFALPPGQRIVPMAPAFLARVRAGIDDLGQAVEYHVAQGGEPLRDCLRCARPGESILLASYCPFTKAGPYKEYGPVFVSALPQGMPRLDLLPLAGDEPYLPSCFVLRAYSHAERIVDACLSNAATATADLAAMFARDEVAFVLARFAAYGCYALRIERLGQAAQRATSAWL